MKKIVSILLAALMCLSVFAFTGCQVKDDGKYTVGICQLDQHPALDAATQGFIDTLYAELGEENVTILNQSAGGDIPTCTKIVDSFISQNVDLIMANATPALQAAANKTATIPVLGTSVTEYGVALNIENFNGLVGANISGTSDLAPLDRQAAMIREVFPDAQKVALIYCSAEANSKYQVEKVTEYLIASGLSSENVKAFPFLDSNEVAIVARGAAEFADVIYIPTDNTAANCAGTINGAIGDVPVVAGEEGICKGCGVVTLTINYYDLGVTTGKMAVKILKGEAKIEDMEIEYTPDEKLQKKYNAAKCEELGIDVEALKAAGYIAIE